MDNWINKIHDWITAHVINIKYGHIMDNWINKTHDWIRLQPIPFFSKFLGICSSLF